MTARRTERGQRPVASGPRAGRLLWNGHRSINTRAGFTLVEMIVVIGIILLIAGLVVPSATSLWNERKMSETINTMQGMFMTSRVRALRSGGAETGFLVFVDQQGNQRVTQIRQPEEHLDDPAWQDVFEIVPDARDHVLPRPIRLVPRYVAEDPSGASHDVFTAAELANNNFAKPALDEAQRHRNFFSVIYSTNGDLIINRNVLIKDMDENEDELGDRTGIKVGPGPSLGKPSTLPTTTKYYLRIPGTKPMADIDVTGAQQPFPLLLVNPVVPPQDVAINFPSVDGLLVYDDGLFNGLPDDATKRQFLLDSASPLYVSRYTGMVIRGPVGESN